jgi:hypothetical protein
MNLSYYLRGHLVNTLANIKNLLPVDDLRKNVKFKNIHKGERLFILGSGHSIKLQDLKLLENEIVMSQNHFHAHPDTSVFKPKYQVVIPKFHPKEYDSDWVEWLRTMEEKLPTDCTYFFGLNTKEMVMQRPKLKDHSYFVEPGFNANCLSKAKVDITGLMMRIPTVITQCLTIAIYMGFSEIYLMGFDLDQLCLIANDRDNVRFYGNSPITSNKAEKDFEKDLASTGIDWFNMYAIWHQLNLLKVEAGKRNVKILNATRGGMLNMFDRVAYEDIIKS